MAVDTTIPRSRRALLAGWLAGIGALVWQAWSRREQQAPATG